jgi:hypothetical protein
MNEDENYSSWIDRSVRMLRDRPGGMERKTKRSTLLRKEETFLGNRRKQRNEYRELDSTLTCLSSGARRGKNSQLLEKRKGNWSEAAIERAHSPSFTIRSDARNNSSSEPCLNDLTPTSGAAERMRDAF